VQALEGRLDKGYQDIWQWRPEKVGKDPESEERASRHRMVLEEASEWKH
jgi:sarcosine oxidase / L-pipecolate oxidase